ncbi:hypothetical protein EJ08DRAFT_677614 [Tothia fuscella]|uniref:Uncharacterized protein n=1 Tax=Tothia fuscella TaxID=1048955 RepID=A0A9P4U0Y7_9PEZI|nr:hypothetical protein EJ08DRAFT_677614 [Tothia fuscella]
MSSLLDSTFTIANLSRPLDTSNGRILASTVQSLSIPSKKRKRSEIAVSTDGQGLNLYNIDNGRSISSHAVSPQTFFVAPPCSIYQKSRRYTYSAVKTSKTSSKAQIICHEERSDSKKSKPLSQSLASSSPVACIEAMPAYNITDQETETHDVIILHNDGTVECFSAGLERAVWTTQLSHVIQSTEAVNVEHADFTDVGAARKGLLKGREDVLALLQAGDTALEAADAIQLLFVINNAEFGDALSRKVHLFALRPRTSSGGPSSNATPQHLRTWPLPRSSPNVISSLNSIYSLHAASGSLEQLQDGSITSYDFSGLSPRVSAVLKSPDTGFQSFIRLSSSLILTASSKQYTIFDIKYHSIQASKPIPPPQEAPNTNKKRKNSHIEASSGPTIFIGHFTKSGVSVALAGLELVGIRLDSDKTGSKRRKLRDVRLIDSMGKGTTIDAPYTLRKGGPDRPSCLGDFLPGSLVRVKDKKWSATINQLDELLRDSNIPKFEDVFANYIHMDTNFGKYEKKSTGKKPINYEWSYLAWDPEHPLPLYREQALYALSKIFQFEHHATQESVLGDFSRECPISIKVFAPNLLQWLAITGQLTAGLVQQALGAPSHGAHSIQNGDLMTAAVNFDPELTLLHMVLDKHVRLDAEEVGVAIKAVLASLDDSSLPEPDPKLLEDANPQQNEFALIESRLTNGDIHMTNGDAALTNGHAHHDDSESEKEAQFEEEMAIATQQLDEAFEIYSTSPISGESLRQALTKLNDFPAATITQTLRKYLNQHEIVFLIHILRVELADGGWTSRYIDIGDEDQITDEPSNRAILVIANILSCAIDAMGMSGWLLSSAPNPIDSIDDLLSSLHSEISATLEGIHEATFLTGLLTEFLRYPYKRAKAGWTEQKPGARTQALGQGKVWTVPKVEDKALPLGISVKERRIGGVGVDHGGLLHVRTGREIGKKVHARRGKYEFEQIRI